MLTSKQHDVLRELKSGNRLPRIPGFKLLVMLPAQEETYGGVIVKAHQTVASEQHASMLGVVIALGELAYSDKDRFPDGDWCREGDVVLFNSYSGTRFKLMGEQFRLINDDTVQAVLSDPSVFERA